MHIATLLEFMREPWSESPKVVDFDWEGHRFWLRLKAGEFVFKKDALDSPVWGAIFMEESPEWDASPEDFRSHFVQGWRENRAGRLLPLPDSMAPHAPVLVGVSASKFWIPNSASAFYTETTHSAKWMGNVWELSQAELKNCLSDDWNDAASLPRRAWEWHRLGSEEKSWSQLVWQSGSQRELKNLTRAMAHSDAELWQERELWGINYKFLPDGKARVESVRAHTILRPPSARLARLGQLFLEYNRATLQRPPLLPALTLARSYSPDNYAFIHLRFSAPSLHEQLEAHLALRAWLRDKISATEIEDLVPRI